MTQGRTTGAAGAAWRRRGDAALRLLAAMPLGYACASLWAMALARILPMPELAGTITASLVAFVLCAGIAMYAYAARSGWRAFSTIAAAAAVAGGVAWLSIQATGRL